MPFPPPSSGGISQLTGDVTAGPGSGSQAATLESVTTAATVGDATHYPVVTFDAKGRLTTATAQLAPSGTPASTVTGPDAFGASAVVGTSTLYAREDHDHGLPSETVTLSNTVTLTNKRITKRVLASTANTATYSVDTDNYDVVHITGQSTTITGFTITGTPVDGDTLRVSITGTAAVGITWGSSFESSTVTLPTTTSSTSRLDVGFFYNTETSKWRCVAVA